MVGTSTIQRFIFVTFDHHQLMSMFWQLKVLMYQRLYLPIAWVNAVHFFVISVKS